MTNHQHRRSRKTLAKAPRSQAPRCMHYAHPAECTMLNEERMNATTTFTPSSKPIHTKLKWPPRNTCRPSQRDIPPRWRLTPAHVPPAHSTPAHFPPRHLAPRHFAPLGSGFSCEPRSWHAPLGQNCCPATPSGGLATTGSGFCHPVAPEPCRQAAPPRHPTPPWWAAWG